MNLKRWLPEPVYSWLGNQHFKYARISQEESAILNRNAVFENACSGKRGFVIGNGESLNRQDLTKLRNEITVGMNRIYLHDICKDWSPTFYCNVDRVPKEGISEYRRKYLDEMPERFKPVGMFYHISELHYHLNTGNRFFVKTDIAVDTVRDYNIPWDLTRAIPGNRTTSHTAIMVAMYAGCNPIYLIGMDNDWLSHRSIDRHFYDGKGLEEDLINKSYTYYMKVVLRQFQGYEVIRNYANQHGIKIFNATDGGFLDVFPRVEYGSLFK